MKDKKVVFMGTPLYSVPTLEMLIENTNVIAVVTQPDKLVGRKKVLTPSPVKVMALDNNIKVFSPDKLDDAIDDIISLNPDIIITCAYGKILPERLIYAPKYDTVNVHASLLPKYRGGAPIHHSIINGEIKTGVTIMYTDKGLDSGDIIAKEEIEILENDTYDIVSEKLSFLGPKLLLEVLPLIFDGSAKREKQDESNVTFASVIKREDEHIDFNDKAINVHNKIRGLSSVPGAYAIFDNQNMKIYLSSLEKTEETDKVPGTITRVEKDGFFVSCLDREIKVLIIQLPGKKKMSVKDYLNGMSNEKLLDKVLK